METEGAELNRGKSFVIGKKHNQIFKVLPRGGFPVTMKVSLVA